MIDLNFSTKSNSNSFQFNNSIINEFTGVGQLRIKTAISELVSERTDLSLNDLSVGLEFTDMETSHFYDSFSMLCRYSIYSYTQATYYLIIAHKGEVLKRFNVPLSNLEKPYHELFQAYVDKLGIILMSSDDKIWEKKGQPATLENFVTSISTDPLS